MEQVFTVKIQIMLNFERFIYNWDSLPKDEYERKQFFKKLEQQFYEEIKNSAVAKEYFLNYCETSIEHFIKSYASKKAHLAQYYQYYADAYHEKEISELQFQKSAEDLLKLILQKKLFNMQVLWRAGQLEINEINFSYDFQFWEDHILSCPVIPLIEKKEVDLMKEYLMHFNEFDEVDESYYNWQDYDTLTEKDKDGRQQDMPEWYEFYDSRMGTATLLTLPNLKGQKEEYYRSLELNDYQKKNPPPAIPPQAPYLMGLTQDLINFGQFYETDKYFLALLKYLNYSDQKEHRDPNYDDLEEAITFLITADRPIYCKSHLNWDLAILAAAKEYKNTKIAENLDFVYEEYLMMKDLGISTDKSMKEIKQEYDDDFIVSHYRKVILRGRTLNGEPEDFNF